METATVPFSSVSAEVDNIAEKVTSMRLKNGVGERLVPGSVKGEEGMGRSQKDAELEEILSKYFRPIHRKYLEAEAKAEEISNLTIRLKLLEQVFRLTFSPDAFAMSRGALKRIYNNLDYYFNVSSKQTDLKDLLKYNPSVPLSSKFIQLVVAIALGNPRLVSSEFMNLENLWKQYEEIQQAGTKNWIEVTREAYTFLRGILEELHHTLMGLSDPSNQCLASYDNLSEKSKCIVNAYSVQLMKIFRYNISLRTERMRKIYQSDSDNEEWCLYFMDMLRLKRREANHFREKIQTLEELEIINDVMKLEPSNPYVRLSLIDCIIDAVREQNGRFNCANIILRDMDDAMIFLRKECTSLLEEFPDNAHFNSVISDYYARYVTLLYFDGPYSEKLLNHAYELNPNSARTTHRLGILHRMNFKNIPESVKWLEKTIELDPFHFNANLDYFKQMLGLSKEYNSIAQQIIEKLNDAESELWTIFERWQLQFLLGLAYFGAGDRVNAMKEWLEVIKENEVAFTLKDMDLDASIYKWDVECINTEKIREWLQQEMQSADGSGFDIATKERVKKMFYLTVGLINPKMAARTSVVGAKRLSPPDVELSEELQKESLTIYSWLNSFKN